MIQAWICSAAWRRFDVTRIVLAQRARLAAELAARGIQATNLIAADDENLDIAEEHGCETIRVPNDPLGGKCNQLLAHAAAQRPDWIVWVGSDDWIHPDAFTPLLDRDPDAQPAIIHGSRLVMVDLESGELQEISSPSTYGAIPWLIDARLLRVDKVAPIRADLPRGLDGALIRGLRRHRVPFEFVTDDPHEFRCVDFKTHVNLSPYALTAERKKISEPQPAWAALAEHFPRDLVDQAERLAGVPA